MIRAVDTSILVAAFASWHNDHELAVRELAKKPSVIAHGMIEAYSVLTRIAAECGAHLISLDRRAETTYLRCGVSFDLISPVPYRDGLQPPTEA